MSSDLDKYIGSLGYLPNEIQKNLIKIRDFDVKVKMIMKHTDRLSDEYLKNNLPSEEKKKERISYINSLYAKSHRYVDNKIKLSYEAYDLVDKNIKRLDMYLAKFEEEINERAAKIAEAEDHHKEVKKSSEKTMHKDKKDKKKKEEKHKSSRSGSSSSSSSKHDGNKSSSSSNSQKESEKRKKGNRSSDEDRIKKTLKKQRRKSKSKSPEVKTNDKGKKNVLPDDMFDMPVDPNEPVYCFCRQVSYGDMVACDDQECTIEWFHFSCVGLSTTPKGTWYCEKCTKAYKKKNHSKDK